MNENGIGLVLSGMATHIVGVEDDPGGGLRVFVGSRHLRTYFVPNFENEAEVERAWRATSRHLVMDKREAWGWMPHATLPGHELGYHDRNRRPL